MTTHTTHTYGKQFAAHYNGDVVTIPDAVAEDQREWDASGKSFAAIRRDGSKVRVRLDGGAYGLHTAGTGDPVVKSA